MKVITVLLSTASIILFEKQDIHHIYLVCIGSLFPCHSFWPASNKVVMGVEPPEGQKQHSFPQCLHFEEQDTLNRVH